MRTFNIVCIGGGHGLSRLLKALSNQTHHRLTAIVTTTDDGGSSGRLREEHGSIAWGDIRRCMSELAHFDSIEKLLFDVRFEQHSSLHSHTLGNLMLEAADQLSLSATDTVNLVRRFLGLEETILPMADAPCTLSAENFEGLPLVGESAIDKQEHSIKPGTIKLTPKIDATSEVVSAIDQADLIILAPGSFYTSVLPPLLLSSLRKAINQSEAQLLMLANHQQRTTHTSVSIHDKLLCLQKIGLRRIDHLMWPEGRQLPKPNIDFLGRHHLPDDGKGRHLIKELGKAVNQYIESQISSIYQETDASLFAICKAV